MKVRINKNRKVLDVEELVEGKKVSAFGNGGAHIAFSRRYLGRKVSVLVLKEVSN